MSYTTFIGYKRAKPKAIQRVGEQIKAKKRQEGEGAVKLSCSCNKCIKCGGTESVLLSKMPPRAADYGRNVVAEIPQTKEYAYCGNPKCAAARRGQDPKHPNIDGMRHRAWCKVGPTPARRNELQRQGRKYFANK